MNDVTNREAVYGQEQDIYGEPLYSPLNFITNLKML